MGDKAFFKGTLPIRVARSVAVPGQKTRGKGGKGKTPKQLTTDVLPTRLPRRTGVARPPVTRVPGLPPDPPLHPPFPPVGHKGSHTAAHRRKLAGKKPRTAKQKAATARNFKKMMASRRK